MPLYHCSIDQTILLVLGGGSVITRLSTTKHDMTIFLHDLPVGYQWYTEDVVDGSVQLLGAIRKKRKYPQISSLARLAVAFKHACCKRREGTVHRLLDNTARKRQLLTYRYLGIHCSRQPSYAYTDIGGC